VSSDSAPPVDLSLRPSRQLAGSIFLAHALALGAAAYAPLPLELLAAAGATVVTSFVVLFRRHAMLLGRHAVRRVAWSAAGAWSLTDGEGREHADCTLQPEPTIGPPLTVLRLKDAQGATRAVLLLEDSVDADQLRRLRARLRLG
jgi:toxin CptA